jgi:hypothetical protein
VVTYSSTDNDAIPDPGVSAVNLQVMLDYADAGSVDKYFVGLAAWHDLGIAGDNLNAGNISSHTHRRQNLSQLSLAETFFQNQPDAQPERFSPHHGQIVDCAVYSQITDITSREEYRVNNIGIRSIGKLAAFKLKERRIILLCLPAARQGRDYQFIKQLIRKPAAAAVAEEDKIAVHASFSRLLVSSTRLAIVKIAPPVSAIIAPGSL